MTFFEANAGKLRAAGLSLLLLALAALATPASAQQLTGEIDGRVVDATGAAVPNVSVVIRNEDQKAVARTVTANGQGEFTVPLLPIARYSVNVAAPVSGRLSLSWTSIPAPTRRLR